MHTITPPSLTRLTPDVLFLFLSFKERLAGKKKLDMVNKALHGSARVVTTWVRACVNTSQVLRTEKSEGLLFSTAPLNTLVQ